LTLPRNVLITGITKVWYPFYITLIVVAPSGMEEYFYGESCRANQPMCHERGTSRLKRGASALICMNEIGFERE
jgi:hypothetical protein